MSPFYITLPPMLHAELSPLAAGLPPSILAAAAGRAARLAGISVTDLLDVDAAHEKAEVVTATLEKVQAQYAKKKAASRDRRSAARKVGSAPAEPSVAVLSVGEPVAVASAAMGISQISIVGAEPEPLPPPPPTPSPPPSPPAKAPPRPSRAVSKKPPPAQEEESEEEESEEEESEEEESEDEESEEEPPSPPARVLSRALSRPAAAPKKAAGNATRARWGL
jgi:outer membrane biosynthesis protein TonB